MLVLALMLSCGCMTPRRTEEPPGQAERHDPYTYHPVALATPILDEEVVYGDA